MPVRILIADDHEVVRQGLRSLLRSHPEWDVCGEASDGREAVEKAPDQVLCWYRQGMCELALDMPAAARKSFMRCLQVHPNHADAKAQLELMNQNEATVWGALRKMFKWS